jgi:N-acetylmuramoyl-L-alanine amidase
MAKAMPGDTALAGAFGTEEPDPSVAWLNRDGFAVLARDSMGGVMPPRLPGYRRWGMDSVPPRYVAIAEGALHGHRIVLDPDGGGENPAGTGPSGTRSASLNLEVARALAGFLTSAGARVSLTRGGDFALSDVERVQISEAFHAERFLRIAHRAEPVRLGYYFSSANGKRWAERTAETFARLGLPTPRLAEDAQYPLQQTSCPALYVSPARVDEPVSEARLFAPGTIRAEAYGLYLALAREWADEGQWPIDSVEVRDAQGRPAIGAAVTLGDAIELETDARGRVRFARTEAGPLAAEVIHGRESGRSILLDSSRGAAVLTGSRGP